ncbi:hypothetical protein EV385_6359 [Krasilnikovia cinnamomea]|uniref:Uncharacterized protein n=1 Tax=Krasilnikovia cinnamomea TaxID=349313 RepID=A0A4Q7ZT60_9ACTN|nr:hypothetical protein [Krasilnikovia cinnamomea]RZU54408.1 hypothetical protein EV385_6359 [Krasilnikovia cinnamomea]
MEPNQDVRITEHPPPASRGTLLRSDAVLGRSDSAAILLRSMVGYDEGIKIETEFLLRQPGAEKRPLRGATDPQRADPAISYGSGAPGEFRSLTWNVEDEGLSIWTLGADEAHSRLTIRTWIEPPPDELVIGVRWLSEDIQPTYLRVDCRQRTGGWSAPIWPDKVEQRPG